ncbi:hypothetical protein FA13DRAFT_1738418 [Coprinellus micaceus]|uniref:Uncharacterized protein n=1 Tax=Coprinellus micaceus TaxID=71717 RepID=A0A4Y7STS7_COPMI|nr:hypothetical protein FA13DRAFT_1738418 [Coprinellus micaceus]
MVRARELTTTPCDTLSSYLIDRPLSSDTLPSFQSVQFTSPTRPIGSSFVRLPRIVIIPTSLHFRHSVYLSCFSALLNRAQQFGR